MEIKIEEQRKPGGYKFEVKVKDAKGESEHTVRMSDTYYKKITRERCKPKGLVKESFRFLLQRQTKEDIRRSFDLNKIGDYFPEYESVIQGMIPNDF